MYEFLCTRDKYTDLKNKYVIDQVRLYYDTKFKNSKKLRKKSKRRLYSKAKIFLPHSEEVQK